MSGRTNEHIGLHELDVELLRAGALLRLFEVTAGPIDPSDQKPVPCELQRVPPGSAAEIEQPGSGLQLKKRDNSLHLSRGM